MLLALLLRPEPLAKMKRLITDFIQDEEASSEGEQRRTKRPDERAPRRRRSRTPQGSRSVTLETALVCSTSDEREHVCVQNNQVQADQQHKRQDTRERTQRPQRRRLKDGSAGMRTWRARQSADAQTWQPRERRPRSQRKAQRRYSLVNRILRTRQGHSIRSREAEQSKA